MTQREAAPILLDLLAAGPKTTDEVRAAIPARNPIFVTELLSVALVRGDVRLDRESGQWSLPR